jgi:hypothetical protein
MTLTRKILTSLLAALAVAAVLLAGSSGAAPQMQEAAWYRCQVGLATEGGVRVSGNYGQLTSVYFISHSSLPGSVYAKELRYGRSYGKSILPGQTVRFDFNVFRAEPIYRIFLLQASYVGYAPTYNVDSTRCR